MLLLQHITDSNPSPDSQVIKLYNCYLELANQYDGFEDNVLPNIKLLSQENKWQEPKCLCWDEGDIATVSNEVVLHKDQRVILSGYLANLLSQPTSNLNGTEIEQGKTNEEILRIYFHPWESLIATEVIGAFLSLLTGRDESLEALAQGYLGNRNIELVRNRLLENEGELSLKHFKIWLARRDDSSRDVRSVLGTYFRASLICNSSVFNLLSIRSQTADLVELEFFPFEARVFQTSLQKLLFKETKKIIKQVYGVPAISLETNWNNLIKSKQLDIQVARSFVLEGAPYVLRALGIHKSNSNINQLLQDWDEKRHIRADLKHQNQPTHYIEEQIEQIVQNLSELFESEGSEGQELRYSSLIAVRDKIEEFGYYPTSIPFELFQNADDAVLELERIVQDQPLEEERKQVIFNWNDGQITFIHWGRPINLCWGSNNFKEDYRKEGFDRDLEKMVTFNISDKANGTTGKFGLGFKSIHLACNSSQIISRDLAFTVLGGLLPARLIPTARNDLQRELKTFSDLTNGTLIRLFIDPDVEVSACEIIANFHALAGLLLVFAKRIRRCEVSYDRQTPASLSWNPKNVLAMPEVETGEIELRENLQSGRWLNHKVLCFRTGEPDYASLLLGFAVNEGQLIASLPTATPTFWVTAPTCKRLNLGFILNANFDVTTGRESLVESSKHNLELADRMGEKLGYVFTELFQRTENDWQGLLEALDIQTIDQYAFWNFIWEELAVKWLRRQGSLEMVQIVRRILGGGKGVGWLVIHKPCLPNGLWGEHQQLVLPIDVKYEVKGVLEANQSCFLQVAQWNKFRQNCHRNLVSHQVWSNLKTLLGDDFVEHQFSITSLKLIDVIQWEVGLSHPCVSSDKANHLGRLITRQFINSLENEAECQELKHFLQQVQFLSGTNADQICIQLLATGEESTQEEERLARFAPDSMLLNSSYTSSAIAFFYACREQRIPISIETLVEWVLKAEGQQQEAVRNYLIEGDRKDELAVSLVNRAEDTWLKEDEWIRKRLKVARDFENLKQNPVYEPLTEPPVDDPEDDPWDLNPTTDDESYKKPIFTGKTTASSNEEFEQFAKKLVEELNRQDSAWKGYIYHFTHVENAASILQDKKLLSRSSCNHKLPNFADSAGQGLIAHTKPDVLSFARFYFRPLTSTQWHNELLGRRRGDIYALCPVPIFLRFSLSSVLRTHGRKCMISDGNLAASSTRYGNSIEFVEQCFDFKHVFGEVCGKGVIFRASQQEFIVNQHLDLSALSPEDITIICRNTQDKQVLINLMGSHNFYCQRIFTVNELSSPARFYHNENPYISISEEDGCVLIQIKKHSERISGNIFARFNQEPNSVREITSQFGNITRVCLAQTIEVAATQGLQFQSSPHTRFSVHFQENGKNWLIYTNEFTGS